MHFTADLTEGKKDFNIHVMHTINVIQLVCLLYLINQSWFLIKSYLELTCNSRKLDQYFNKSNVSHWEYLSMLSKHIKKYMRVT